MIQRGIATFTLDSGQCPPWLFERMVSLGREMTEILIDEFGADEFVKRMADPVWFQSLGTVLAFDWNASGLTTILTAALKEAIRGHEREFGIAIAGGKGKTSRKAPEQIAYLGERLELGSRQTQALVYNSKMSAKVDSALVQDGFQLYHHSFFFSRNGAWAVVQQGMNTDLGAARRYHWFSEKPLIDADQNTELRGSENGLDFVCEPHAAIATQATMDRALDIVAKKSGPTRSISVELVEAGFAPLMKEITILRKHSSHLSKMMKIQKTGGEQPRRSGRGSDSQLNLFETSELTLLKLEDVEFKSHPVVHEDFSKSKYLEKILSKVTSAKPKKYEELVAIEGVGPKTLRALALVGEIIYGASPSYEDPARYSFAHGGKDATPYPVDRITYDQTIHLLAQAVRRARISALEKDRALFQLDKRSVTM